MNTRIQVEHPVTELVTGIDLVRQLEVAEGRRWDSDNPRCTWMVTPSRSACMRRTPPQGSSPRSEHSQDSAPHLGLAFGWMQVFRKGDIVSPHYDPMLAKLIAHGPDRHTALGRLRDAIDGFLLLGVRTNLRFLRELLDEPMVIEGETTTTSLEMRWPEGGNLLTLPLNQRRWSPPWHWIVAWAKLALDPTRMIAPVRLHHHGDAVEVVSMIHLKGPEGPIELNPVDGPMGWEWNGVSARPVSEDVIEVSWGGRTPSGTCRCGR